MSHAATKWAWDQLDVSGSEKLVLLRLADHAHPDGTNIKPGRKSVAVYCGLSERQVERYIQGFLDRGLIAYEENEKGGRGNTPVYFIPAVKGDANDALSSKQRATPVTREKSQRATPRTQRATPVTVKGDTGDGTYKEEPSRTVNEPLLVPTTKKPSAKKSVPGDFAFSEAILTWAAKNDYTAEQLESQREAFIDHHTANASRFSDWDAAFRKWMRNAREWGHLKGGPKVVSDGSWRVIRSTDGGYDPLQKLAPESEEDYYQRFARSMAEAEGISVDAALERLGRKSA